MSRKKYPQPDNTFGGRLTSYRILKNLDMKKFAELVNISQGSLSDIENNKRSPRIDILKRIVLNTDINITWLITGEGEMVRSMPAQAISEEKEKPEEYKMLEEILASDNPILKRAISANLEAFSESIKKEEKFERQMAEMKVLFQALIKTDTYIGPDRRKKKGESPTGKERRAELLPSPSDGDEHHL